MKTYEYGHLNYSDYHDHWSFRTIKGTEYFYDDIYEILYNLSKKGWRVKQDMGNSIYFMEKCNES